MHLFDRPKTHLYPHYPCRITLTWSGRMKWKSTSILRWITISKSYMKWKQTSTFMSEPVFSSSFIGNWRPRLSGWLFSYQDSFRNWRPLLFVCQSPNVNQSGNRLKASMWALVSDFIAFWKLVRSMFWTALSNFISSWKPECSISYTPVLENVPIRKLSSKKYWKPISKKNSIWKSTFKGYCRAVSKKV